MADNNQMLLYAVAYETVEAALADMDAVEQLHKDKMIGKFDAAVIDQKDGKPHIVKRMDRSRMRVIPEWFGGGTLPRKESSMRRLRYSPVTRQVSSWSASRPSAKDSTRRLQVPPKS